MGKRTSVSLFDDPLIDTTSLPTSLSQLVNRTQRSRFRNQSALKNVYIQYRIARKVRNRTIRRTVSSSCAVPPNPLPLEANREFLSATDWLNDVLRSLIRDRYRQVAQAVSLGKYESGDSRDLVTFIVEESLLGGVTEGIGENEFLGHLLEFMAAGHDTSANMLSWSLYVLATHPDIQTRLRQEASTLPASPTYAQLDRLPYLENFSKEILRMYCPGKAPHARTEGGRERF